jgi:hypothetical protein
MNGTRLRVVRPEMQAPHSDLCDRIPPMVFQNTPKTVARFARVEQYTANEESGKNEKKVNAGPTEIRRAEQQAQNSGSTAVCGTVNVMLDNN